MMLGCLGFIAFIALIVWAFIVNSFLGVVSIIAGIALFTWKWTIINGLGALLFAVIIAWGFNLHWIIGIIFSFIGLVIICMDLAMKKEEEEKELSLNNLIEYENFEVTHQFNGDNMQMIIVDESTKRFAYLNGEDNRSVYSIKDILKIEIREDDDIVTRTSNDISASGPMLGGMIGGGAWSSGWRAQQKTQG
ncbi:hypothetical protein [Virgibacillus ihumii]|uniref:hypothetical protein n=1 Tax=Virgibacillus ihumii TaxID=2686091 RepID=UPI00157DC9DC|nr:hypothetical protein [Virgibacillus ihumii]